MKDIFTELYKKVIGLFQAANEKEENENVKNVACNRLKLVLMQDRTNLTPLVLERMRGELIQLLSKYVEMDQEALELNFANEGDSMALMLSIPVLRAKEEDEIKAIIEAEDKAKAEAEEAAKAKDEESENAEETSEEEEKEVCACGCEDCDCEKEETSEETCECGCEDCDCQDEETFEDDEQSEDSEPETQQKKKHKKKK